MTTQKKLQKTKIIFILAMVFFAGLQGCNKDSFKKEDIPKPNNKADDISMKIFEENFKADMKRLKDGALESITYKKTKEGLNKEYILTKIFTNEEFKSDMDQLKKYPGLRIIYHKVDILELERSNLGSGYVRVCMSRNFTEFMICVRAYMADGYHVICRVNTQQALYEGWVKIDGRGGAYDDKGPK